MATRQSNPIESKTKRQRLAPRREPYWYRVSAGCQVGYRRLAEGEGTWIAKYRDGSTGERSIRSLGTIADTDALPAFEAARRMAQQWFDELVKGVDPEPKSVADACRQYAKSVGDEGSNRRRRADQDFARLIYSDPIAGIELFRLREVHVKDWRARMEAAPNRIGRSKRISDKPRAPATVNRDLVGLRAALNLAAKRGQVISDIAWRTALEPLKNADRQRTLYLTREQRQRLLEAVTDEFRPFLRALTLLPLRPGAVAALTVGDFDARTAVLTIRADKGQKTARSIKLPTAAAALFKEQARRKLPSAPLFSQAIGSPWNRNEWAIRMRAAVKAAGLPAAVTLYSLRHATLSDLVTDNRLSLLALAQIAGTSVRMVEKHYGHLRHDDAAAGLEILSL